MTAVETSVWSETERQAWAPPEELRPSEWATRYRRLPRDQSPRPGPWDNDNAPYLRGIMDLPLRPGVEAVSIMKAAQVGASEALRNLMGTIAHEDADPIGLALPDREKGRKIVINRVIPLFTGTQVLRELFTERAHDLQAGQIRLNNGFLLHLMWSGSPSAMASDPMRIAICDEVDKFQPWARREADPVSLITKRLRAYEERGCLICISTPTTRLGKIFDLFDGSNVKLYFHVPCPHCGTYQRLVFAQLRWPKFPDVDKNEQAARIVRENACWYECADCGERIEEQDKPAMVRAGRWATLKDEDLADGERAGPSPGRVVIDDAEAIDRWPRGTRIGIQISALYCLWESWASIAAEFLKAEGNLSAMFDFRTETLGEPFEQQITRAKASVFGERSGAASLAEGIVPAWAVKLLAAVDTQHDHFWCVIRAWGPGMRSARVWHGRVETFEELERLCLNQPWPIEEDQFAPLTCELTLIDSGGTRLEDEAASRTMQVYRWVLPRRARVRAIKGTNKPKAGLFVWRGRGFIAADVSVARKRKRELALWFVDTHHFNDELADLIGDEDRWQLNARHDEEYNRHLSSVEKVLIRHGSQVREEWVAYGGARHDLRDCEAYQVAAAYMAQVHLLPPPDVIHQQREAIAQAARRPGRKIGREDRRTIRRQY